MSLVDGHLVVSSLPNASYIPLLVATAHTVPHVAPVVSYQFSSPEHL